MNEKDQPPNKDGFPAPPLTAFPKLPVMPANPSEAPTVPPNPIARIGGDGTPSAPPITIAPGFSGIKPLPPVRDVNNSYVCQNGDTNFATLSTRLYGTPKYADALLAYNRDHARWIKNGSIFLANAPSLTPGQQVEYPPIEILERSYRSLIREASVNPIPSIPSAPLVKLATPAPLNPGIATNSNPPAAGQTRNYKVQNPNGENILDIAERMLGKRSLWTEIYRINQANPAVRPPATIPAGTDLKLPAN
jgi:nucleoid-associated protein YgaU